MQQMTQPIGRGAGRFWVTWGFAFLGFPLGGLAAWALIGPITTPARGLVGGIVAGALIGAVQWLALHRRIPLPRTWIAATALGMGSGLALATTLGESGSAGMTLAQWLITGASVGLAQAVLLCGVTTRALIWTASVTLGWALGWTVTRAVGVDLAQQWAVFGSSGALVFQLITGIALGWMLRHGYAKPPTT